MSGGCTIRFDENDDVVIDDIPDDIMAAIEHRAATNGHSAEDEMRDLLLTLVGSGAMRQGEQKSPLPRGRGLGEGGAS